MIKTTLLSATIVLVIRHTISACLTSSQLAFFNLTATDSLKKDNATKICQRIYNDTGYCATEQSVKDAIEQFKQAFTKQQLDRMGKVAEMVQKIAPMFSQAVQGAFQYKGVKLLQNNNSTAGQQPPQNGTQQPPQNGTQAGGQQPPSGQAAPAPSNGNPPPPNNSTNGTMPPPNSNNGTAPPPNSNNGTAPPRVDKSKLNLNGQVLDNMQKMKDKMDRPVDFLKPMTNNTMRQDCTQSQFRLLVGAMCMITSGDGSKYVQLDASGQISGIYVNPRAADEVIHHCIDMLSQACDLADLQTTVVQATNGTTAVTPTKPDYCNDLNALKNCAKNATACTDSMRKAVLEKSFAPFSYKLADNIDTTSITTSTTTLDQSLTNTTTTTARRLAGSASNVSFVASSAAPDPVEIATTSQISVSAVEDKISVPESLKSSAGIIIILVQAIFMCAMI